MPNELLDVTIIGFDSLQKAIAQNVQVTQQELLKAMNKTAIQTERLARQKAPHDKGQLRSSIHHEPAEVTATNVIAKVGTNVEYAIYQEDGTGIYGATGMPITPKRGKYLRFKTADGGWHTVSAVKGVRPKHYMRDALQEIAPVLTENVGQAVQNIIKKLALG